MFIDLPVAFNILRHSRLLPKSKSHSFEEIELDWRTNYLLERSQRSQINEKVSNQEIFKYCDIIRFVDEK